MNQFEKDYKISREKEIEFEKRLIEKNQLTENSAHLGKFPFWDVSSTSTTTGAVFKYEVKYQNDYKQGNVVIENGRRIDGKIHPAGLNATNSDYYVFSFENDDNFYLISVKKLNKMFFTCNRFTSIVHDSNGYILKIINKEYFMKFIDRII